MFLAFLVGCSADPVYIAGEIAPDELWNYAETTVSVENFDAPETSRGAKELSRGDGTVYYTASGSVWHVSPDCSSLSRAKKVFCGTVEQAIEAGMSRECKLCGD